MPVTYFNIWLVVLVISGFSYMSLCFAQTYFFQNERVFTDRIARRSLSQYPVTSVFMRRAWLMKNERSNVSSALIMMHSQLAGYYFHTG
ncbi:hypothetical protein AU255_08115 [Methyloprofundus sedimenti]|uniref:Uncharacterized protein n=1 Tax=Methyloprofundus sedimenti TaxID=1420851 RepID=A0A1V8M8E4_9GAMM|nr:hypothetical protein AU255_08115 [Methyloprofundus sedimenti]